MRTQTRERADSCGCGIRELTREDLLRTSGGLRSSDRESTSPAIVDNKKGLLREDPGWD